MSSHIKSETAGLQKPVGDVKAVFSFRDIMSEQLAVQLSEESDENLLVDSEFVCNNVSGLLNDDVPLVVGEEVEDTSSDLLLAAMLQHQFDSEHDEMLKIRENKSNGLSKVVVSYTNFRAVHPAMMDEEEEPPEIPNFVDLKVPKPPCFNKYGISGKGKNAITKHDITLSSIRNANKVIDTFPPGFETGNNLDFDMRIPNRVYNNLKRSAKVETKRSQRNNENKELLTQLAACDKKSKLVLYKLVNNGTLESLSGVISMGKEAVVLHGVGGSFPDESSHSEVAVKVYKTTLGKFKNRCEYVTGDWRFIKDDFKKPNPRKIMSIWAEKENMNLRRMRRFDLPCPEPITVKKHILVMSFIGKDGVAARKLVEMILTPEQLKAAYRQSVNIIKKMYKECHLVHADMSEYNLLWHEDTVYVIDVAQAVDSSQSKAMEFLMRDCRNLVQFFKSRGSDDALTWQELFTEITEMSATGEGYEFLSQILRQLKDKEASRLDNVNDILSDMEDLTLQER